MDSKLDLNLMGARIRFCRKANKLKMKEFAELCSISERYLADLERGIKAPKLETLVRIANSAGVTSDYLLRDSLQSTDTKSNLLSVIEMYSPVQQEIISNFIKQFATTINSPLQSSATRLY